MNRKDKIIDYLEKKGTEVSRDDISEKTNIDKTNLSKILALLEKDGRIERRYEQVGRSKFCYVKMTNSQIKTTNKTTNSQIKTTNSQNKQKQKRKIIRTIKEVKSFTKSELKTLEHWYNSFESQYRKKSPDWVFLVKLLYEKIKKIEMREK